MRTCELGLRELVRSGSLCAGPGPGGLDLFQFLAVSREAHSKIETHLYQ